MRKIQEIIVLCGIPFHITTSDLISDLEEKNKVPDYMIMCGAVYEPDLCHVRTSRFRKREVIRNGYKGRWDETVRK